MRELVGILPLFVVKNKQLLIIGNILSLVLTTINSQSAQYNQLQRQDLQYTFESSWVLEKKKKKEETNKQNVLKSK